MVDDIKQDVLSTTVQDDSKLTQLTQEELVKYIKELRSENQGKRIAKNDAETKYNEALNKLSDYERKEQERAQKELESQGKFQELNSQLAQKLKAIEDENKLYKEKAIEYENKRKEQFQVELEKITNKELKESFQNIGISALDAVIQYNKTNIRGNNFVSPGVEPFNHTDINALNIEDIDTQSLTDEQWTQIYATNRSRYNALRAKANKRR